MLFFIILKDISLNALKFLKKLLLCYLTSICLSFSVHAATIHYQATDLVDLSVNGDLWRHTYTVSNHDFNQETGFSVFFDSTLYSQLQNPVPIDNADWDVLVIQPDPLLFADAGVYDALSLADSPSLADSFSVDFIWLGEGVPSIQNFEVYDVNFEVIASGNTVSAVPLPASLWLFLSGLWLLIKPRVIGFTGFFNKEAIA